MPRILFALIAIHAIWLGWCATLQSPTLNEPGHLVSGLAILDLGRFDVDRVNTPLVKVVAALPVVAAGTNRDWDQMSSEAPGTRSEFLLGSRFVHANRDDAMRPFVLARWACIPFSVLAAWLMFIWGKALYGSKAGILAATLWCLDPTVIGHGQLVSPDVACTALGLAASFTFWRWLYRPTLRWAMVAGAALGLANLAKMTWLILFGLWPFIWILHLMASWRDRGMIVREDTTLKNNVVRRLGQLALLLLVGLYILNMGYCLEGTGEWLRNFEFISRKLSGRDFAMSGPGNRFQQSWLGSLPVPLPREYVLGLDHQMRDFEVFPMRSYLRGEWRHGGWWYYYFYAAFVKLPCGTWLLILLAGMTGIVAAMRCLRRKSTPTWQRSPRDDSVGRGSAPLAWGMIIVALPGLCVLLITSSQTEFNHHFRYVLPAFGPLFVLLGSLASPRVEKRALRIAMRIALFGALAWIAISSARHGTRSLSYFNEIAGGPEGGRFHLLHSNLDWGQDLLRLKNWQDRHAEATPLTVVYYGLFDPADLGLHCRRPIAITSHGSSDARLEPGWYAVSVNYLMGCEWPPQPIDATKFRAYESSWISCGDSLKVIHVTE